MLTAACSARSWPLCEVAVDLTPNPTVERTRWCAASSAERRWQRAAHLAC
jgi:hypothetical protein